MARFLLIGLDGAEPTLVERWMGEGRLPCLAALRERGCFLPCQSTVPPATFPAWTTCVTGVNPGRHGVFDFTEMIPGAYGIRFINRTFRKVPALWNVLSEAGKQVGVLGVPATYPPESVNGFMVSGFDSPVCTRIDRSFVYPSSLYPEVRGWRFADLDELHVGYGWHERALPVLLDGIKAKTDIAANLLAKQPWDFFMVVFGEADTVSHHFWLFHDPASPRHIPGPADAIRTVYEHLDATVGRLMEVAGRETTLAVVSDHGFGGAGSGVVHLNNWLAEHGYLSFADLRHSQGGLFPIKQLALSTVPNSLRGKLFTRFSHLAARIESQARFARIDWSLTRAWSEELNYAPSIRVNLRGREPNGQVAPEDYDRFCEDLCRHLESWFPVRKAWRREDLYSGPHVDRAPDIVLELAFEDGYSYSCLRSTCGTADVKASWRPGCGPAFRRLEDHERFGGKERGMTGNHRSPGILFLSQAACAATARLGDVAPTVLAELGVAGPPMEGRDLLGPAAPGRTAPPSETELPREQPYSAEQQRAVEERLRTLGYYE